jgi:hypothetical protein
MIKSNERMSETIDSNPLSNKINKIFSSQLDQVFVYLLVFNF